MVAATLAGAAATNLAASFVVMCSITTFRLGTLSSIGIYRRQAGRVGQARLGWMLGL